MIHDTPIEISRSQNPSASVIWLHGLGADGSDFVPIVEMLNLADIRFILPHAPYRKVTINNGYEMRAWYDLLGLDIGSQQDEAGIRETQTYVENLISQEISRGITHDKIALAGFSQGGAIALHTGLRQKNALAGMLALSTYLPLRQHIAAEKSVANQHSLIYMAHGTYDEVISLATFRVSLEALLTEGYQVEWHEYAMAHSLCMEEINDIKDFLLHIFAD